MSLHKLTAGDGYAYLTRQVAAHDGTERGTTRWRTTTSKKVSLRGWTGRGLVGLSDFPPVFMLPGFTPVDERVGGDMDAR